MGIFPSKLNIVNVTPIYKSEDRSAVNNYRPISVLPIFSKIIEKSCIIGYYISSPKNYYALTSNQFGFRERDSTFMEILNVIDKISSEVDNKQLSMGRKVLQKLLIRLIIKLQLINYIVRGLKIASLKNNQNYRNIFSIFTVERCMTLTLILGLCQVCICQ